MLKMKISQVSWQASKRKAAEQCAIFSLNLKMIIQIESISLKILKLNLIEIHILVLQILKSLLMIKILQM